MSIVNLLSSAELMNATGVGRETLRYYEAKGMLKAERRTRAGYRQYAPNAVELIGFIKETQRAGFSLKEIQDLLRLRATALNTCDTVTDLLSRKLDAIDAELVDLQRKRSVIEAMVANCCAVNSCQRC